MVHEQAKAWAKLFGPAKKKKSVCAVCGAKAHIAVTETVAIGADMYAQVPLCHGCWTRLAEQRREAIEDKEDM